jgi:hypothetical protein
VPDVAPLGWVSSSSTPSATPSSLPIDHVEGQDIPDETRAKRWQMTLYDRIGTTYATGEPTDRHVLPVEPSAVMRAQRPPDAAPCIGALAEALPIPHYWLVRDYLTEFAAAASTRPTLAERARVLSATITPVEIPWDCRDGFFHAYWRRPDAYLDPHVRANTSVWARYGVDAERRAISALRADLDSGVWHARNANLLTLDNADLGARLLVGSG